jgi:hypothetical protein
MPARSITFAKLVRISATETVAQCRYIASVACPDTAPGVLLSLANLIDQERLSPDCISSARGEDRRFG